MDPVDIDSHLLHANLKQLIMFTGLDVTNNPQHGAIYNAFLSSSSSSSSSTISSISTSSLKKEISSSSVSSSIHHPINYKMLTADHELFQRKSAEKISIVLKNFKVGILKQKWPWKYLADKPALVVCFVDLDWDNPSWYEKKTECESKINSLRQSIGTREIRLAIVLIQKNKPIGDRNSLEKAAELCSHCRLNSKYLFVLPLQLRDEYILRLEKAFHEIAQDVYLLCLKRIRAKSIPNNDTNLIIRQQYQLAFVSELRQDTHSALRYYKTAYQNITEIDFIDNDVYEILAVASLLNFKICELAFLHNSAFEAVSQFRKHQNQFFNRNSGAYPTPSLAAIEFALWKSQQCRLFAELFERAINVNGLAAYSFQNPGRFLEEAAGFFKTANLLIKQLKSVVKGADFVKAKTPPQDPLQNFELNSTKTMFYGQRPWRNGYQLENDVVGGGIVADQITELTAKKYLEQNLHENYQRSLQLFSTAIVQFKRYNCEAMQHIVMIQMADDYVELHQLSKALQLLNHVANEFRNRNFQQLLQQILIKYLNIAYFMVNINEYVWALIQLLNPILSNSSSINSTNEQNLTTENTTIIKNCCENFIKSRFSIPPTFIPTNISCISNEDFEMASSQWDQYYNHSIHVSFSVEMSRLIYSAIQCRVRFLTTTNTVCVGETIPIEVQFKNFSKFKFIFNKCLLAIDELCPGRSTTTIILENQEINIELEANCSKILTLYFSITPTLDGPSQIEKQILIQKAALKIVANENELKANASFDWEVDTTTLTTTTTTTNINNKSQKINPNKTAWDCPGYTTLKILPKKRNIGIKGPESLNLFLDEAINFPFEVSNNENFELKNIKVICQQIYKEEDQPENTLVPVFNEEIAANLPAGNTIDFSVLISTKTKNFIALQVQINCLLESNGRMDDFVETKKLFYVVCKEPFLTKINTFAMNGEKIGVLVEGQKAQIEAEIEINSNELQIQTIRWNLNTILTENNLDNKQLEKDLNIKKNICQQQICPKICLNIPLLNNENIRELSIGNLILEWKRYNKFNEIVRSTINLGQIQLISIPVVISTKLINYQQIQIQKNENEILNNNEDEIQYENELIVRQPFTIDFILKSNWNSALKLHLEFERSDGFVFSGPKEFSINLQPGDVHITQLTLAALSIGQLPYPKLNVSCSQPEINKLIQSHAFKSFPSTLYILVFDYGEDNPNIIF